ncbi:unnamed protein product [Chrysodeixis includens]|uniref:Uncharacterized protein n=1 Tax=Chrysodeixis includens TaxID=689277 RepID=A0A9P0FU16_CHRIL|nr:unnamed protein product [Chrysodeixis includens]
MSVPRGKSPCGERTRRRRAAKTSEEHLSFPQTNPFHFTQHNQVRNKVCRRARCRARQRRARLRRARLARGGGRSAYDGRAGRGPGAGAERRPPGEGCGGYKSTTYTKPTIRNSAFTRAHVSYDTEAPHIPDMSHDRYLLIAAVVIAAAAYVLARPQQKEFVLSDVANKTMCPIKVEIDDNPERIPRRIKFLKCASRPNKLCSEHHISHGCCKQHHHAFVTECVEIFDWVQVTFKGSDVPEAIKVPVGCTCLIEETTQAAEVS